MHTPVHTYCTHTNVYIHTYIPYSQLMTNTSSCSPLTLISLNILSECIFLAFLKITQSGRIKSLQVNTCPFCCPLPSSRWKLSKKSDKNAHTHTHTYTIKNLALGDEGINTHSLTHSLTQIHTNPHKSTQIHTNPHKSTQTLASTHSRTHS